MQDYARRLKPHAGYAERVHRLDRDTTGALAFALSRDARAGLIDAFRAHRIERRYLAIVEGRPEGERGTIDAPVREAWVSGRRGVAAPGEAARPARTRWVLRERLPGAALLEVELETGRQHQVRAHLAHAGLPILGDPVYGRPTQGRPLARRPMLHAAELAFAHPITGARVHVTSPLPSDFESVLAALRKGRLAHRIEAPPRGSSSRRSSTGATGGSSRGRSPLVSKKEEASLSRSVPLEDGSWRVDEQDGWRIDERAGIVARTATHSPVEDARRVLWWSL